MSEEEIIDIINDFLQLREIHSTDTMSKSYLSIYKEAIQCLLDLYNKEKDEVIHWKEQYHLLSRKIGVISENKITKRIEEIKKIFPNDIMFTREFLITELKGLLEE